MQERGTSTQSSSTTSVSFSQFPTLGAIRGAKIVETTSQLEQPMITRRTNQKSPAVGNFVRLSCAELSHELILRHEPLLRSTTRTWIDHHACLPARSDCERCDLGNVSPFQCFATWGHGGNKGGEAVAYVKNRALQFTQSRSTSCEPCNR